MFSTVEKDETVLASFMNGSWSDEYELRLGNELISEENWSEAVLYSEKDITIHIVEKPRRTMPHHLRPSREYSRAQSDPRRRSYSPRSTNYGESVFEGCTASSNICTDRLTRPLQTTG